MEGMEIVRCQCWRETPNRKWIDAVCIGTREQDACSCGGDQMKCDFYPEIRAKAKKEPDIQAAIAYYNRGIKEDIFSPEVAEYARMAVNALRKWGGCVPMTDEEKIPTELPPTPKMEVMTEGLDLPMPVVMAPAIVLIVCAILRQVLL